MAIGWYLSVSAMIFCIGAAGVLTRRNPLVILLCLELMLNAANLALVAFSRMWGGEDGQIFALIVMVVAACEVTVGLGLIVAIYRRQTADRRRRAQRATGLARGHDHIRLADPAVPADRDDRSSACCSTACPAAAPAGSRLPRSGCRSCSRSRRCSRCSGHSPDHRELTSSLWNYDVTRRSRREAVDPRRPAVGVHDR